MNTDFVINMSSKADYFDSERVLSKWGFTDSNCHFCGISNSEIDGELFQSKKMHSLLKLIFRRTADAVRKM